MPQTYPGIEIPAPKEPAYTVVTCRVPEVNVSVEPPYVEPNNRERARMRAIVEGLADDQLRQAVNDHWTVSGVLGHIAFWDARALALADRLEHGRPFTPDDNEP